MHNVIQNTLNILNVLSESTGLAGRSKGAVFKNPNNQQIIFQELQFYPQGGGILTDDEMSEFIEDNPDIKWMNKRTTRMHGLAIANFTADNNVIKYGFFLEKINPNLRSNYIPNKIDDFTLDTKAANKAKEPLKPQDLLKENKIDLTIKDILNQLKNSLGQDNSLYLLANEIANGRPLPIEIIPPVNASFTGFRDYFCEILQPIAILRGQYSGNAMEAAKKFMGGSFKNSTITFDESVTAGLSDSILKNSDGKYVLISTKGGDGAKASAKNIYDQILKLEETQSGSQFLSEYSEVVDIIKNIVKFGQNGSPLYLAVKYNIINSEEADQIKSLRNKSPVDLKNIDSLNITDKLKRFAIERKTKTPQATDLYYHLMASIAEKAANEVNDKTNFSAAASAILNNGALIQVYTVAAEKKDRWILEDFETVYPSDNIKGVYLYSGKTYYSTDIKGNYTFLIDKGQGVPKKDEQEKIQVSAPVDDNKPLDLYNRSDSVKDPAGRKKRKK